MIINWGDAPFKAFITVTYPSGTCTVTGEGQTYTHTGGGTKTFTVKKKGTYTIKAENGSFSDSTTATITKRNQTVTATTLKYILYLIQEGTLKVTFSTYALGDWAYSGSRYRLGSNSSRTGERTYAYANLKSYANVGFKKITIDGYHIHEAYSGISSSENSAYGQLAGIGSSYSSVTKSVYMTGSRANRTIDISNVNLSTYPVFSLRSGQTVWDGDPYYSYGYYYNIYLTT